MKIAARRKAMNASASEPRQLRVATYVRKSHAAGLDQEFNSLHAQRQAISNYIASQKGNGWIELPNHYEDGGYSGATTERPGFQRMMADIAAGKIDCVAVYRIDRLSRSLSDYVAILQMFEDSGVTFVSVSEQFNTTTPTGRLVLRQLILFSEFEREVIAERIRDKVRATRGRGAWTGGRPFLGYDVIDKRLVVNEDEAHQVRECFRLYLERGCLREAVAELERRGWGNKQWRNGKGVVTGGARFTKTTLHALLTNIVYTGQMRAGPDLVPGAHDAIVDAELWAAVQQQMARNSMNGGSAARNKANALLRKLLHCGRCGSPMTHVFTTRGTRRNRYYLCSQAHSRGAAACPKTSLPAGDFEQFIVDHIRVMGTDEVLLLKTAEAARTHAAERRDQLAAERRRLQRQLRDATEDDRPELERRVAEVRAEAEAIGDGAVDHERLRMAVTGFQQVWEHLFPGERERILRLLIERVTHDPDTGDVEIDLRAAGIEKLAMEAETSR